MEKLQVSAGSREDHLCSRAAAEAMDTSASAIRTAPAGRGADRVVAPTTRNHRGHLGRSFVSIIPAKVSYALD